MTTRDTTKENFMAIVFAWASVIISLIAIGINIYVMGW